MDITFYFMWTSGTFFLYLLILLPILYNLVILLITARKDKNRSRYKQILLISQIISLGLIIGSFFIPVYSAEYINLNTDLPLIYGLGFLYLTIFVFPYIITQGVVLTLYGFKRKEEFSNYLMIAGIMTSIYYSLTYIYHYLHGVMYTPGIHFGGILNDWFLYNFTFFAFLIVGYYYYIKYGYKANIKFFRSAGTYGIGLLVIIETFKWFIFFNNIILFNF